MEASSAEKKKDEDEINNPPNKFRDLAKHRYLAFIYISSAQFLACFHPR